MLYILGNACRDLTFRVDSLPAPGATLNALSTHSGLGGKGLNQAIAAARAGADVRLIAPVGDDAAARVICETLEAEGIPTDSLIASQGDTDISVIIVAEGGENMIVTNAARAESITVDDINRHLLLRAEDALLLQGNLLAGPTRHAAKRAREAGAKVIFNAAPYRDWARTMSDLVDALILNAHEAQCWAGAESPEHAIGQLTVPLAVVTRGAGGCLLRSGGGEVIAFPAPRREAKDTSGAGDVFAGVFAAEWLQTDDEARAVRLALSTASESVMRRGTLAAVPSREEIRHLRANLS